MPGGLTTPHAVTAVVNDGLFVFAVDWWNQIWYQHKPIGGEWNGAWIGPLGFTDVPVGAHNADGDLHVFVKGLDDGRVWERIQDSASGTWSEDWVGTRGTLVTDRGLGASAYDHWSSAVFARDTAGYPRWLQEDDATPTTPWDYIWQRWGSWIPRTDKAMAATQNHQARENHPLSVFLVSTENRIYRNVRQSGKWGPWIEIGGITDKAPAVATDYTFEYRGEDYLFVKGKDDNAMYYKTYNWNTYSWSQWHTFPWGITREGLAAAELSYGYDRGTLYVFCIGKDDYQIYYNFTID